MGEILDFYGKKTKEVSVNDMVSFWLGNLQLSGLVVEIKNNLITVKVDGSNFRNCLFTIPVQKCVQI